MTGLPEVRSLDSQEMITIDGNDDESVSEYNSEVETSPNSINANHKQSFDSTCDGNRGSSEVDSTGTGSGRFDKLNPEEEIEKKRTKRGQIVNEILATEKSYVSHLKTVANLFMNPLRESPHLLDPASFKMIFSDIEVILQYHTIFLDQLEERVKTWDSSETKIGDVFLMIVPYLKVYTGYVNNYTDSHATLKQKLAEDKDFASWNNGQRNQVPDHLDLDDFLIMPVQRIPRYEMLLVDLGKNTWESHPDFFNLKSAKEKIAQVADFVNEQKRKFENDSKMGDIINSIIGFEDKHKLMNASRHLIKSGNVSEVVSHTSDPRKIFLLLFNDIVIWTIPKKKKSQFEFVKMQYLENVIITRGVYAGKIAICMTIEKEAIKEATLIYGKTEELTTLWHDDLLQQKSFLSGTIPAMMERRKTFVDMELFQSREKKTGGEKIIDAIFKNRGNNFGTIRGNSGSGTIRNRRGTESPSRLHGSGSSDSGNSGASDSGTSDPQRSRAITDFNRRALPPTSDTVQNPVYSPRFVPTAPKKPLPQAPNSPDTHSNPMYMRKPIPMRPLPPTPSSEPSSGHSSLDTESVESMMVKSPSASDFGSAIESSNASDDEYDDDDDDDIVLPETPPSPPKSPPPEFQLEFPLRRDFQLESQLERPGRIPSSLISTSQSSDDLSPPDSPEPVVELRPRILQMMAARPESPSKNSNLNFKSSPNLMAARSQVTQSVNLKSDRPTLPTTPSSPNFAALIREEDRKSLKRTVTPKYPRHNLSHVKSGNASPPTSPKEKVKSPVMSLRKLRVAPAPPPQDSKPVRRLESVNLP
eukprot:TRINITY_DN8586_c1_g1_i1.p1 TRINITY_DN8586_c1_g1~~TRINITY_DN8586_c1_g1_i1.p1  ORF type:complete len:812 (-),score=260.41 TRINITY_DN8586_c1_g1_i1:52-2487(-)